MIEIIVNGKRYSFPEGRWSLADLLWSAGYEIPLPCAGLGNCGKCQIKVRGDVEILDSDRKLIPPHRLSEGYLLACRVRKLRGSVEVELPNVERRKKIEIEEVKVERVNAGVDLGTTSIVVNFSPVERGRVFYSSSSLNPQTRYGADVISRVTYIGGDNSRLQKMRQGVVEYLNGEIESVREAIGFKKVELVGVAGNSIMEHIFLNLDPSPLTRFPFTLSFKDGVFKRGEELGISAEKVFIFPLVGAYVGGDTVALLMDLEPLKKPARRVIVDIGTNGEIVVQNGENLFATAAAAGPAFEGGNITFGMRAENGAIERFWMEDDRLKYRTIGNLPPEGICGSGLMDLIAVLTEEGVVDENGAIRDPMEIDSPLFSRVKEKNGERIFLVYRDVKREIYVTQKDIREFQLAKGAIRAGMEVLLKKAELSWQDIDEVIIAGAFGSYLMPDSLISVGMFPEDVRNRIVFTGDAVIRGVNKVLGRDLFDEANRMARKVKYVELSLEEGFQEIFLSSLSFRR